jgi:hypothetical protein
MGWETRQRGGRYYTRSRRVDGRVVREYVGTGRVAELAASEDAARRQRRGEEVADLREAQAQADGATGALAEFSSLLDGLVAALLVGSGYHRHHRGEWRKRRGTQGPSTPGPTGVSRRPR